ncbi:unnamed protein product [Pseudo-nitzschia multistriata]|uniref:Uncharacterized protein n=1 Tax=Pseudo-nitzschia multistriata TaxID=183589 RepID=A0A448ZS85_9STRA|nr:unnamed protein product [Pseudo-nitzschia multistriata]
MNQIATIKTATVGGESAPPVSMDSLPYVETVHEDYEEYALAMIEEEMKAIAPRPMKKIFPMTFRTTTMRNEYNNLVVADDSGETGDVHGLVFRGRPKEQLKKFQHKKIVKPTTTEEWTDAAANGGRGALSQIKARYEAERLRNLLLEVEKEEGIANWKDYNARLNKLGTFWSELLKDQMDAVEEINFRRQQAQTQHVGPEIDRLNQEYEEALYRRNKLEYTIEGIRRETKTSTAAFNSDAGETTSRKRRVYGSNAD